MIQRILQVCIRETVMRPEYKITPLPMTHSLMRPAQYSLLHHSTRRRRVSRPMGPPSSPDSRLIVEFKEVLEDETRDEVGFLLMPCKLALPLVPFFFAPSSINFRAALVKLALFPLPHLLHTWPGFVRCLLS